MKNRYTDEKLIKLSEVGEAYASLTIIVIYKYTLLVQQTYEQTEEFLFNTDA